MNFKSFPASNSYLYSMAWLFIPNSAILMGFGSHPIYAGSIGTDSACVRSVLLKVFFFFSATVFFWDFTGTLFSASCPCLCLWVFTSYFSCFVCCHPWGCFEDKLSVFQLPLLSGLSLYVKKENFI